MNVDLLWLISGHFLAAAWPLETSLIIYRTGRDGRSLACLLRWESALRKLVE